MRGSFLVLDGDRLEVVVLERRRFRFMPSRCLPGTHKLKSWYERTQRSRIRREFG